MFLGRKIVSVQFSDYYGQTPEIIKNFVKDIFLKMADIQEIHKIFTKYTFIKNDMSSICK